MWLVDMDMVVRRYKDFLILLIHTSLESALFGSIIPTFVHFVYIRIYLNIIMSI